MKISARRAMGLIVTSIFLLIYILMASSIGNMLYDKSILIKFAYFAIAGLIWVLPLYPLFKWMRARPGEVRDVPKPPKVSG